MTSKGRIIVIGAGMAGLTAAHFLKEAGFDVVVVEKENRPGGRVISVHKDGDVLDVGAQFLHSNYRLTLELTTKFNMASDLVQMQDDDMIMRDGRAHIIPWGSVRIPAVSIWSQLKMARLFIPIFLRKANMALEGWPGLLDLDKLELATYARLKLNNESLEYVVRPLMLTYSMSEPEGISLAYFLRSLYMYVTTKAYCFRSGNDVLAKTMSKNLDIRYESPVKKLLKGAKGEICGVQTSSDELEGLAVISAVPSPALFSLYPDWNREQSAFLQDFTFSKMPLVLFEGKIRDTITYWGGVFDRRAGHRVSFVTYPHRKYTNACKANYLLAWSMGSFGEELLDLPDEGIAEAVAAELRKAIPADADSLKPVSIVRHHHTFPQFKVGMFEKLLHFRVSEGQPAGLYFAGDYMEGGIIEGAVQSGYKAAQRLIAACS
ncbi:FAD-dependent oxidoreductase [Candidatus Poribacteria bacterium]|nr:FAD-dependent oxidoreductase [Candidatus Poribacteria bacterium]